MSLAISDWGMIEIGQCLPPWKPKKDINAASQDSIGTFEESKDVKLDEKDHAQYNGWEFVSKDAVQVLYNAIAVQDNTKCSTRQY